MASCCRRYRARRLKAFAHDPQLLVIRPAPPPTSLDHLKPFKLSTALMAVHKDCYAPIGLIQQGGPRRRKTNPTAVPPGSSIDLELNNVKANSDGVLANLARIQRDDGALANGSVSFDQLSPGLANSRTSAGPPMGRGNCLLSQRELHVRKRVLTLSFA